MAQLFEDKQQTFSRRIPDFLLVLAFQSMNDSHYDFALLVDHQHVFIRRSKSDPNLRQKNTNETILTSNGY